MLQTSPVFVSQYPSKLVLGESSVPESSITTANIGNLSNVDSIVSAPAVDNRNSLKEGNFNPVLMFFFRLQACVLLISLCYADVTFNGIKDSGKASKICTGFPENQVCNS